MSSESASGDVIADPETLHRAKEYSTFQHYVAGINILIGIFLPWYLWESDLARLIARALTSRVHAFYPAAALFLAALLLIQLVIRLPLSYYAGHIMEHHYGLSNQTTVAWLKRKLKEIGVGMALTIPFLLLFYFSIRTMGEWWWLAFGILFFALSILLAELFPVVIIPLFYKVTPLPEGELKSRLTALLAGAAVGCSGLFRIDFSKETKKANAMFTGWGKTRRALLADTLIEKFSVAEVEAVLAHELGHLKRHHIAKHLAVGFVASVAEFYLLHRMLLHALDRGWIHSPSDLAGFPILWLGFALMSVAATPLQNALSRRFEWQADAYAGATKDRAAAMASAFRRLAATNLADPAPHPAIEWYFYSHPALARRIAAAERQAGR